MSITGTGGGAIFNNNGLNFTIVDSTFINCFSPVNGGAIRNAGPSISVINSHFENNTSGGGGSAISSSGSIDNTADISITDSNFIGNTGINGAAAVNLDRGKVYIANSTFENNTMGIGTGIYANITLVNSTITNNNNSGIVIQNGTAILTGNNISNNGGPGVGTRRLTVINLTDNEINGNSGHGVDIASVNSVAYLTNNEINGNGGSAIFNTGATGVLNLTFIGNSTLVVVRGSTITLYATLTDDMGNTVTGLNISFYLNGVLYENVEVIEGIAEINYTVTDTGLIPVSGEYEGSGNLTILINDGLTNSVILNITINIPDIKVGESVIVEAIVVDQDGNPVANQTVDFFVDGVLIGSGVTDDDGVARINHTFDKAGDTEITVIHVPDTPFTDDPVSVSKTVTVNKHSSKLSVNVPKNVRVGETVTLESTLTDEDGNPVANQTVDFYVDGKKVGSAITDANGVARLQYTFTKAGNPTITVKFQGNDYYLPSNVTSSNQITVSKTKTKLTVTEDGNKITVTLTDEDGNPIKGKTIYIRVKGHLIKVGVTNANGQVTFIHNGPTGNLEVSFLGDDQFKPATFDFISKNNPKDSNNNPKASTNNAEMKNTGMPIVSALAAIIAIFGLIAYRRRY